MTRLGYVEPEDAQPFVKKLFEKVGMVPNLYCMMANSAMSFDGFIKLNASLEGARLEKRYREMIYLATSQLNGCEYCQASHTATSVEHKILTSEECLQARRRQSPDPRADALLKLTDEVVTKRGHVTDEVLWRADGTCFPAAHGTRFVSQRGARTATPRSLSNSTAGPGVACCGSPRRSRSSMN